MTMDEIMTIFDTTFTAPGSDKDGEYLLERLLDNAGLIIKSNRLELIEIFYDWISQRSVPQAMMAMIISGKLNLWELSQPIKELGFDISSGKVFFPHYMIWIDQALVRLRIEN